MTCHQELLSPLVRGTEEEWRQQGVICHIAECETEKLDLEEQRETDLRSPTCFSSFLFVEV